LRRYIAAAADAHAMVGGGDGVKAAADAHAMITANGGLGVCG